MTVMKTAQSHQQRQPHGDRLVDSEIVGEGWAPVEPGADPVLYGHAQILSLIHI